MIWQILCRNLSNSHGVNVLRPSLDLYEKSQASKRGELLHFATFSPSWELNPECLSEKFTLQSSWPRFFSPQKWRIHSICEGMERRQMHTMIMLQCSEYLSSVLGFPCKNTHPVHSQVSIAAKKEETNSSAFSPKKQQSIHLECVAQLLQECSVEIDV